MKSIYVWERVENATVNYHDEGGIFVVADGIDKARELIKAECPGSCEALTKAPDHIYPFVGDFDDNIIVFQDAGCC